MDFDDRGHHHIVKSDKLIVIHFNGVKIGEMRIDYSDNLTVKTIMRKVHKKYQIPTEHMVIQCNGRTKTKNYLIQKEDCKSYWNCNIVDSFDIHLIGEEYLDVIYSDKTYHKPSSSDAKELSDESDAPDLIGSKNVNKLHSSERTTTNQQQISDNSNSSEDLSDNKDTTSPSNSISDSEEIIPNYSNYRSSKYNRKIKPVNDESKVWSSLALPDAQIKKDIFSMNDKDFLKNCENPDILSKNTQYYVILTHKDKFKYDFIQKIQQVDEQSYFDVFVEVFGSRKFILKEELERYMKNQSNFKPELVEYMKSLPDKSERLYLLEFSKTSIKKFSEKAMEQNCPTDDALATIIETLPVKINMNDFRCIYMIRKNNNLIKSNLNKKKYVAKDKTFSSLTKAKKEEILKLFKDKHALRGDRSYSIVCLNSKHFKNNSKKCNYIDLSMHPQLSEYEYEMLHCMIKHAPIIANKYQKYLKMEEDKSLDLRVLRYHHNTKITRNDIDKFSNIRMTFNQLYILYLMRVERKVCKSIKLVATHSDNDAYGEYEKTDTDMHQNNEDDLKDNQEPKNEKESQISAINNIQNETVAIISSDTNQKQKETPLVMHDNDQSCVADDDSSIELFLLASDYNSSDEETDGNVQQNMNCNDLLINYATEMKLIEHGMSYL